MSEVLWKCNHMQLPSAWLLLEEINDHVSIFKIDVAEGVQQLCWGMKKILLWLKGKGVKIRMDVTCKTLFNDIISANEYDTNR